MKSILEFYPYPTFRDGHRELLLYVEANINKYDIFLIVASTGCGKTAISQTISAWYCHNYGSSLTTAPTNQLVFQQRKEFPETAAMFGKDSEYYNSDDYAEFQYDYYDDKANVHLALSERRPILVTPYAKLAHRLGSNMFIADEGHKILELNADMASKVIWREKAGYPHTVSSRSQLEAWLKSAESASGMGEKARKQWLEKLQSNDYLVKREQGILRSKAKDCIKLIPLTPGMHPAFRRDLKKLVLLSATLSELDVANMKIGQGSRACKLELPSIIPPERRPIVRQYVSSSLNFFNLTRMADEISAKLVALADWHSGSRGLAHVTYGMAELIRARLQYDPRFIFHTKYDAKAKLRQWQASNGKVFVAAGFAEGLDLKGAAEYPWQAICKIAWPSLTDPAIKKLNEINPSAYTWFTLRDFLQRLGRICRGPEDYGVTYVLDPSLERLLSEGRKYNLLPGYLPEIE